MNRIILTCFDKKLAHSDFCDLTKEFGTNPKFKVRNRAKITKYENIFSKGYIIIGQEKYL